MVAGSRYRREPEIFHMTMRSQVFRVPMSGPSDVSGVKALIDQGKVAPEDIVAILGKTEGNGCVNDFTRGYSTFAFQVMLSEMLGVSRADVAKRVAFVMSGGTEGVLSPHATVFARRETKGARRPGRDKRLSIGVSHSREFKPEEIGTAPMVKEVARATKKAIEDAGIAAVSDVHFVQIKCPLLTSERMEEARRRGRDVVTHDTYESMGYSRGASALGVAVALGEVKPSAIGDAKICHDWNLYSRVASTSAGIELMNCEIIVMGNAAGADSDMVIGHSVMKDAIDGGAVRDALHAAGIRRGRRDRPRRRRSDRQCLRQGGGRSERLRAWHAPHHDERFRHQQYAVGARRRGRRYRLRRRQYHALRFGGGRASGTIRGRAGRRDRARLTVRRDAGGDVTELSEAGAFDAQRTKQRG